MSEESENTVEKSETSGGSISSDDRTMPLVTYGLMIAAYAVGVTAIIGVILAYVTRAEASAAAKTHYDFIIRTFWISLIVNVTAFVLMFTIILAPLSFLTFFLVMIWYLVRMIMGLVKLANGDAIANPQSNMLP